MIFAKSFKSKPNKDLPKLAKQLELAAERYFSFVNGKSKITVEMGYNGDDFIKDRITYRLSINIEESENL